jgi:hypothetical protein
MNFIKNIISSNQKLNHEKLRNKLKTTLFVSIVATIFFSILVGIVCLLGFKMLNDKGVESQSEIARTLASAIDSTIEKQVELLKLNANSQFVIDALKAENLKYRSRSEKETQRYLMDIDKRWIDASDEHPFIKEYLENNLSRKLRELKAVHEELINLTVTDKFGGLAGSTTRTSGFYSFDKDWWLSSYAKGYGKPFVGNVEYDEASNLWYLSFAVPIEDEARTVIGIYRATISLDTFFKPLLNFKLGKTGNVVLADDKAYLVYHSKSAPFANKFCEYEEFQKVLQDSDKWGVLGSVYLNRGKMLAAYAEVNQSLLSPKGIKWFVFVDRDLNEIFAPLNKLIFVVVLIGIALVIILALSVFILSGQDSSGFVLQVDKDTASVIKEEEDSNLIEEATKCLPEDK